MKYADLHTHTNFSDGTLSPGQLLGLASDASLSCISICDHDSVSAYPPPSSSTIEVLPGIELTADSNNSEVHILGYLIDYEEVWFQDKLKELRQVRIERMSLMCGKLTALGMPIGLDEVLEQARCASVGRLHLARLMVERGFVSTLRAAFDKYIGEGRPAYASKSRLTPGEVIEFILKARGVAVLAHPHTLLNQDLIPELVKSGLRGIEVFYPEHSKSQTKHYEQLAKAHNLLLTGGSDYHGEAKPKAKIGSVKIPYELVEKLKAAKPG